MESVVGGRGGVAFAETAKPQQCRSPATAELFCDLQRESSEQALLALAALEYYEQELLRALRASISSTT